MRPSQALSFAILECGRRCSLPLIRLPVNWSSELILITAEERKDVLQEAPAAIVHPFCTDSQDAGN